MGTPLKKVRQDFIGQKLRTVIVVLSIMVGVFCITGVGTVSAVLTKSFEDAFSSANAPDITALGTATDRSVLASMRKLPNVTGAEGRLVYQTRWRTGHSWFPVQLTGMRSFQSVTVEKVPLKSGHYPTAGQIMPEYTSLQVVSTKLGQHVQVQGKSGIASYPVSGYGVDSGVPPSFVTGVSTAFMPLGKVQRISGTQGLNEFVVTIKTFKQKDATLSAIRSLLQGRGVHIFSLVARDPNHLSQLDTFKSLTAILVVFGYLALALSGMLVVNTLSTLITEQIPSIGTMKAVGATRPQVTRVYLTLAFLYGLCGTVLGLILGVLGAYAIARAFATQSGFTLPGVIVSPVAVGEGILVGIGITLIAALLPILSGSKITVREAISSYGIGTGYKPSRLDLLIGKLGFLSRPARMSVRNTFRRRMRLALTLAPLTLAGATFIAVSSTGSALDHIVSQATGVYRADTIVSLQQPTNSARVKQALQQVNGVSKVEPWYQTTVTIAGQDGIPLSGAPSTTREYHIVISKGRWPEQSDSNVIVVGDAFARQNNLKIGQLISVKTASQTTKRWKLIGTVNDRNNNGSVAFAPLSQVQTLVGEPGQTNYLFVTSTSHSHSFITGLIDRMGDALIPLGAQPTFRRVTDVNQQIKQQFTILTNLFFIMVVLLAIVGALGLFAVLAMNVVERRKEIGVMRSIGASSLAVIQVFTVEGATIGLLAAVLGTVISLPIVLFFSALISKLLVPIDFTFSAISIVIMLLLTLLVAAIASIAPAATAARLRIADVLRYG